MFRYAVILGLIYNGFLFEEKEDVINLYQRPILPINPNDNTFNMYIGLTKNHQISAKKLLFTLDLNFDHILLGDKITCADLGYCDEIDNETHNDTYNGNKYTYKNIKALAAPQIVSPVEIDEDLAIKVSRSKMRLVQDNKNEIPNVLGLSPKADAWIDWTNIYFIRFNTLNITYHINPGNEYMLFYSKIYDDDVMISVKKEDKYKFDAKMFIKDYSKSVKMCLRSDKNSYFELNDELYNLVLDTICKSGTKCINKHDLKDNLDGIVKIELMNTDSGKKSESFIKITDLVSLAENEKSLIYKFDRNQDQRFDDCDVVLQNKFFEQYYLLISNDVTDQDEIKIGLRKIKASDFFIKNLWKYLLMMTCICLAIIIAIYVLKGCKKEENRVDDYTSLPFTQTSKEKND